MDALCPDRCSRSETWKASVCRRSADATNHTHLFASTPWKRPVKRSHRHCKLTPSGTLCTPLYLAHRLLIETSIQDALRAFLPPIKNDDVRLDFYTVYKREATEYDMDYVKKYDEDLNTTLIFVRRPPFALTNHLICPHRLVCSLPSALHSSSTSNQIFSLTRMSNQQPSSAQSFSPSIAPRSPMKPPPFHPSREIHLLGSSPYLYSCTRVSWSRCLPHLLRCWGSNGSTDTCGMRVDQ